MLLFLFKPFKYAKGWILLRKLIGWACSYGRSQELSVCLSLVGGGTWGTPWQLGLSHSSIGKLISQVFRAGHSHLETSSVALFPKVEYVLYLLLSAIYKHTKLKRKDKAGRSWEENCLHCKILLKHLQSWSICRNGALITSSNLFLLSLSLPFPSVSVFPPTSGTLVGPPQPWISSARSTYTTPPRWRSCSPTWCSTSAAWCCTGRRRCLCG